MWSPSELLIAFIISIVTTLLTTPIIIGLATKIGATDKPDNYRKMHNGTKPSMGGLAIFIGVTMGFLYLEPYHSQMGAIILGATIMLITGAIDDLINLKPIYKLIGQISAALVVVSSGLVIEKLTIPFMGTILLEEFGVIITVFWILAASNAINLIDGLDGLAAGVSAIALTSILVMAFMDGRILVIGLCLILIGSCLGFLFHNFHPAKIFMGDTGALFLGYSIAIVSMLGLFKNVAFFSFLVPIIVLGIPVFDTICAIIRRIVNKQGIAVADKKHIHYRLMNMGYSHRTTVLILYAFSTFFGITAIIFNSTRLLTSLVVLVVILIAIQLIMELAGITMHNRKPLMDGYRKIFGTKLKFRR